MPRLYFSSAMSRWFWYAFRIGNHQAKWLQMDQGSGLSLLPAPPLWAPVLPQLVPLRLWDPAPLLRRHGAQSLSASILLCLISSTLCWAEPSSCCCLVDGNQPFFPTQMQILTHFHDSQSLLSRLGVGTGSQVPLFSHYNGCKWENHTEMETVQIVPLLYVVCVCADRYRMWNFSHTHIWCASKSYVCVWQFLFLASLWNL